MALSRKWFCYCCVPGCRSCKSRNPEMSFHNFPERGKCRVLSEALLGPSFMDRQEAWARKLKIDNTKCISPKRMKVCSLHFINSDFTLNSATRGYRKILKKNAVPSLNLPILLLPTTAKITSTSTLMSERAERRNMLDEEAETVPIQCQDENCTVMFKGGTDEDKLTPEEMDAINGKITMSMPLAIPSTTAEAVSSSSLPTSMSLSSLEVVVKNEEVLVEPEIVTGRRIVDLAHFFSELCSFPHNGLFTCKNDSLHILHEKQYGLQSSLQIECKVCKVSKRIWTDSQNCTTMNINESAVLGCIANGGSFAQIQQFCVAVNVPTMSPETYYSEEKKVQSYIKPISWEEMEKAGKEEFNLELESKNVDEYGITNVTVRAAAD